MNLSEFKSKLNAALLKRGISEDIAAMYTGSICRSLTDSDTAGASDVTIAEMADTCVDMIRKKNPTAVNDNADAPRPNEAEASEISVSEPPLVREDESTSDTDETGDDVLYEVVETAPADEPEEVPEITYPADELTEDLPTDESAVPENSTDESEDYDYAPADIPPKGRMSTRSIAITAAITLVLSPLWVAAAALFFVPFGAVFAAEFALIGALVALLAAGVALGAGAALTGIVYGVIRIFTTLPVGLYEIGFGIIIAGVTMMFGILIYNGAVRFMPWVIRQTAVFFKFAWRHVTPLLAEYKRRCEKL